MIIDLQNYRENREARLDAEAEEIIRELAQESEQMPDSRLAQAMLLEAEEVHRELTAEESEEVLACRLHLDKLAIVRNEWRKRS